MSLNCLFFMLKFIEKEVKSMDGLLGRIFASVVSGGDESIELGKRFDE